MNAAVLAQLVTVAMQFALKFLELYPSIRDTLSSNDKEALDAEYARFQRLSNDTADTLRATPPDPV